MLILCKTDYALPTDDYAIWHKENGLDELEFSLAASMGENKDIGEEDRIYETTENIYYLVKAISGNDSKITYKCQIDLDDWKREVLGSWANSTHSDWSLSQKTAAEFVTVAATAAGWSVAGDTTKTTKRSLSLDGPTPIEAALEASDVFGFRIRFDNKEKVAKIIYPTDAPLSNSFATRSSNLKSIKYTGKSSDFCTRLYASGKDGLTFASINNGKPYVEDFTWSDKIVCGYWQDERYTIAANLLEDTRKKLAELAIPTRTWKCNVVDLYALDKDKWPDMSLALFTVIRVVDDIKGETLASQIVEDKIYPYYPDKNTIVISTAYSNVQKTVQALAKSISNRNSTFWQTLNAR